ncbi:hypothetical protein ACP70R_024605 [Stipagrostis hirtigluma subsp. patula]
MSTSMDQPTESSSASTYLYGGVMGSEGEVEAKASATGSDGEAEAKASATGSEDEAEAYRASYMAAFGKLTRAERWEQLERNKAIVEFLVDSINERQRLLKEDPARIPRPEERQAALARVLDAHPLPETMRRAGVEDYMRKFTLPRP